MTPARLAVAALLLWPLSYLWIPFARGDGSGEPAIFAIAVVAEIGAVVAGTAAVVTGLRARRWWPAAAGAGALVLVVALNVLFVIVL